jgi:hypothetical protein
MALNAKVLGCEQHEVIYTTKGVIEGVVAVGTLSNVIGTWVIGIRNDVLAVHAVSGIAMG